jgi:hypothetical protein
VTATVEARLTNMQLLMIGIYAGRLSSCFIKAFVCRVIEILAGSHVRSDADVIAACESALAVDPQLEPTKVRKARQRALKRALSRSNLPPSAIEQQIGRARRPKRVSVNFRA